MKNISKELKAGFVALAVLALFYWGFSFLKGKNLLKAGENTFYVTYDNVGGLKKSSEVNINGFSVGKVIDIHFDQNATKKGNLIVEFSIDDSDVSFSKNSIAQISSGGLMGGKTLTIIPSYDGENAVSGDFLKGEVALDMMSSFANKLDPIQIKATSALTNIDSVAQDVNILLNKEMILNLQQSISHVNNILTTLEQTTKSINVVVRKNESNIDATLKNMSATTKNLKMFSDSLSQVQLLSISKKMNTTMASLNKITADVEAGKGSLGKLTKDEALYHNLEGASKELEELLRDMKEHPKRFVHFSLFGKKDKGYQKNPEK